MTTDTERYDLGDDVIRGTLDTEEFRADGNAFALIGKAARALREAGNTKEVVDRFMEEAMAGDYDCVIRTCIRYVELT